MPEPAALTGDGSRWDVVVVEAGQSQATREWASAKITERFGEDRLPVGGDGLLDSARFLP